MEDVVPRQDLDTVKWLSNKFQGFTVTSEVGAKACKAGAMEILKFFKENDSRLLEERGEIGRGHPTEWRGFTMSAAVLSHRSDIVWWLHRNIPDANYDLEAALSYALMNGDILVAEWLVGQGAHRPERFSSSVRDVVSKGRLDVLQWLVEQGQLDPIIAHACTAAQNGHLEMVRWIIDRTLEEIMHRVLVIAVAALSIHTAAIHGHLSVAKYLRNLANGPVTFLGIK